MIELAASLSSDTFVTMMGTSAVLLSADPSLALKVNLSVPLKPSLGVYVKAPVSALKPVISPDLGSETMHSVTVVSSLKSRYFLSMLSIHFLLSIIALSLYMASRNVYWVPPRHLVFLTNQP